MSAFDLQRAAMLVTNASPAEKHVLLALAVRSKDGVCHPGIARIVADTGLSERTVQRAIRELVAAGHITQRQRRHETAVYTVHPMAVDPKPVTVTGDAVTPVTPTPVKSAAKTRHPGTQTTKNNHSSSKTSSSSKSRARSPAPAVPFPMDFAPAITGSTGAVVNGWPPGRLEAEVEAMADWHAKEGKLSRDWQASWRTWVRNSTKWDARNDQSRSTGRSQAACGPQRAAITSAFDRVDFG